MITIIRQLFVKKTNYKRVLEKVEVNTPFEEQTAPTTKKSRKKTNA